MVGAASDPVLTDDEVATLLTRSKVADSTGRAPSHADWEPTYNLHVGAAMGWRWKAVKVSDRYDFSADGSRFDRSQVRKHCLDQAKYHNGRAVASLKVTTSYSDGSSNADPVVV